MKDMETLKVARFEFSLFGINTYVVWNPDSGECAVIDPGMFNSREEKALDEFIERKNLKVTHLINTHLHIDHAVGNRYVTEKYGVKTEASVEDAFLGKRIEQQALMFGIPDKVNNVPIGKELKDGDVIRIGNGELHVLAVPGHSPGGLAFYDKEDGFVISGDSLFQHSIGRSDLPGGDQDTLISAITEKLLSLPPHTAVYPGHGPATTIGDEIRMNPYLA